MDTGLGEDILCAACAVWKYSTHNIFYYVGATPVEVTLLPVVCLLLLSSLCCQAVVHCRQLRVVVNVSTYI